MSRVVVPASAVCVFLLMLTGCGDDVSAIDGSTSTTATSTSTSAPTSPESSTGTSSATSATTSAADESSSSGPGSADCPEGLCSTRLPDDRTYGRVTQVGQDVMLVAIDGAAQPSQLMTVDLDGTLVPTGPSLPGEASDIVRGSDGVLTAAYFGAGTRGVVRLVEDVWEEVDVSLPDGSVIEPSGVFATATSPTYLLTGSANGGGPLFRVGDAGLISEPVNAATMVGLSPEHLWAFDGTFAYQFDGTTWSGEQSLPEFCSFGVVLVDEALCGSPLDNDLSYWDGTAWTSTSIEELLRVKGLAEHGGTIRAVGETDSAVGVSTWSDAGWTTQLVDLHPESEQVQVATGAATLSDGRLVFLVTLNSGGFVDGTSLVIENG